PRGVSMFTSSPGMCRPWLRSSASRRSPTSRSSAASSALGRFSRSTAGNATARKSSSKCALSTALVRTTTTLPARALPSRKAATRARASALPASGTESSRSKEIASASPANALAKSSSRAPGTRSLLRPVPVALETCRECRFSPPPGRMRRLSSEPSLSMLLGAGGSAALAARLRGLGFGLALAVQERHDLLHDRPGPLPAQGRDQEPGLGPAQLGDDGLRTFAGLVLEHQVGLVQHQPARLGQQPGIVPLQFALDRAHLLHR